MLEVWGRKTSSNVQAVMWCIGELGLPYRRHDIGHRFGGTDTDAFGALNPNRTVPVLQDGTDPPLWETGAILRYLANRYGSGEFWPEELIARTDVDRWAEWAKINVSLAFTAPVFWRVVRTPEAERDPDAIRDAVAVLEKKLQIADARLAEQAFLVGDEFTMADIQFGHVLFRYFDIDIDRAALPGLARYYERLCARPAFREHVMVSYEKLRL
ncbi:glutathione S-transferase family protein [Phaeobacter sp. 22II1-1F12B]|uniref:glutathione S-transferase family protein n=1 Tax=Phaeobacter sp. 22II1-1F12B TaxID=1317111 RepID=UPI000B5281FA|nr:glutathione S-transferase family protein [Phaeobacter sp. 22II1-1F12B]OWU80655.1 glutathione S-transferase [Phaeobacter sp. 22II1-1F12B]